ncbi:MAG: NTP transferase domain-containing protein [Elusimicrobia bacterium]|nr:NTP transferase domain-containing protein [Elusimicrobiota bacterium]
MIPVLILTAGGGKRLGRIGNIYNKALLPVGDKSLLEHHLSAFSILGEKEFVIVVDPRSNDVKKEAKRIAKDGNISIKFVSQTRRLGIGHAVLSAETRIGKSPFILVLGDTYYIPLDILKGIKEITKGRVDAVLSVRTVSEEFSILKECTIEMNHRKVVHKIIEKPEKALSMFKPCGVYFFGPRFIGALKSTPPSRLRGEIELTDAIQKLIDLGGIVVGAETLKSDVNITYPEDILSANLCWLKQQNLEYFSHPQSIIGSGVKLKDSVISRRCKIGESSKLNRTVVFPGAEVPAGSILENQLILSNGKQIPV